MQSSKELRDILHDLEADAEQAGAKLIQAEAAHRSALRRAIENHDPSCSLKTEAALTEARIAHSRAIVSAETARTLLTEALKRERVEAQDKTRSEIAAKLADMAALADEADEHIAAFVGLVRRIKATETELHGDVRRAFDQAPWRAPQALSALRSAAGLLISIANGLTPEMRPFAAEAVADAARNITDATPA